MKLKKASLIYDISNLAFVIGDVGDDAPHIIHQLRDICQEGNVDRVARILGLAYSKVLNVLSPILKDTTPSLCHDFSASVHDYVFDFDESASNAFNVSPEKKFELKETIREFMVCFVLADWLSITYPEMAETWKKRADDCLTAISLSVSSLSASHLHRKLSPF